MSGYSTPLTYAKGMLEDLDMDGLDYNIALSTFFITYILFGGWSSDSTFSQRH